MLTVKCAGVAQISLLGVGRSKDADSLKISKGMDIFTTSFKSRE